MRGQKMTNARDVKALAEAVRRDLGPEWARWPGGWPGEIEAAVVDSVCSVRARYGSPSTGVRAQVAAWRTHRDTGELNDVGALVGFTHWNETRIRPLRSKIAGRLKAEIISDVATRFSDEGIVSATDLLGSAASRDIWMGTPGLGFATWKYVQLLLGVPTAKPDSLLTRYVTGVIDRPLTPAQIVALIEQTATTEFSIDAHLLDHALWRYESAKSDKNARSR